MTVSAGRSPQKSSVGWKWLIMMLLRCIALPVSFLLDTLIAMHAVTRGARPHKCFLLPCLLRWP